MYNLLFGALFGFNYISGLFSRIFPSTLFHWEKYPLLHKVFLNDYVEVSDDDFEHLLKVCTNIDTISMYYINDNKLELIKKHLSKTIQTLKIHDVSLRLQPVTDKGISYLESCTKLSKLTFSGCYLLTSSCISSIAKLHMLTHLKLNQCGKINTLNGLESLKLIKSFTFKYDYEFDNYAETKKLLSSESLFPLLEKCDCDLIVKYISTDMSRVDTERVNLSTFEMFLKNHTHIHTIDAKLENEQLILISQYAPQIKSLKCSSANDETIIALVNACKQLESIDLSDCLWDLTDDSIISISTHCTNLTNLSLKVDGQRITRSVVDELKLKHPICMVDAN